MKHSHSKPKSEVYWYRAKNPQAEQVSKDISAEVIVVGGGMSGLSVAQKLSGAGKKVILVESGFCGAGASGKTSGFITPDSELELSHLIENYGKDGAKKLWSFVVGGVDIIRNNIEKNKIDCDYQVQDSFFIANSDKAFRKVKDEHEARISLGYKSTLYTKEEMTKVLGSTEYFGGVRYPDTFGINSFLYCQAIKDILKSEGVQIYESSPVEEIGEGFVKANGFTLSAPKIVVATDKFLPELGILKNDVYHAQTFLSISKPLSDEVVAKLFPSEKVMVWDTDLIYQYYRLVAENRLLVGAASMFYTYIPNEHPTPEFVQNKMHDYIVKKFPELDIELEATWPGMLGVSRDFVPIVGEDKHMKGVYFIGGATGLPWAAALGTYIAEKIINGRSDYDKEFTPDRKYKLGDAVQFVLRKPINFAINHGLTKYFK